MLEATSLVQANIDVDTPIRRLNRQIFYGDILAQFLRQISVVKILILSHYALRVSLSFHLLLFSYFPWPLGSLPHTSPSQALEDVADANLSRLGNLPTFSNLTPLEVGACNDQQ